MFAISHQELEVGGLQLYPDQQTSIAKFVEATEELNTVYFSLLGFELPRRDWKLGNLQNVGTSTVGVWRAPATNLGSTRTNLTQPNSFRYFSPLGSKLPRCNWKLDNKLQNVCKFTPTVGV